MTPRTKKTIWDALKNSAQPYESPITCHPPKNFSASTCNIHLDYSNQKLSTEILHTLFELAHICQFSKNIHSMMKGDKLNVSEQRPALHTALRAMPHEMIFVDLQNVVPKILEARHQIETIAELIRANRWLGFSGKPIKDIVNIGIGGSHLGPYFAIHALKSYCTKALGYHFISDVSPESFQNVVEKLNPETTLFIISSKSFTTPETIHNAIKALQWIGQHELSANHFIAITAREEKARQFGIKNIIPIWDWVGGRFSFCSAINLITAIAIGSEQFNALINGAHQMDRHVLEADDKSNLPLLLALIGIWNINFLNIPSLVILPYARPLEFFVPFIQQMDMESNGKSIDREGRFIQHATSPIIWGGMGNDAQHSYFQLLCQGTHKITADFISLTRHSGELINSMCESRMHVLAHGRKLPHQQISGHIQGGIPLNHIQLSDCTPFTIGALVALFEHKIFIQSIIWNTNPFDQPGVESAKQDVNLAATV